MQYPTRAAALLGLLAVGLAVTFLLWQAHGTQRDGRAVLQDPAAKQAASDARACETGRPEQFPDTLEMRIREGSFVEELQTLDDAVKSLERGLRSSDLVHEEAMVASMGTDAVVVYGDVHSEPSSQATFYELLTWMRYRSRCVPGVVITELVPRAKQSTLSACLEEVPGDAGRALRVLLESCWSWPLERHVQGMVAEHLRGTAFQAINVDDKLTGVQTGDVDEERMPLWDATGDALMHRMRLVIAQCNRQIGAYCEYHRELRAKGEARGCLVAFCGLAHLHGRNGLRDVLASTGDRIIMVVSPVRRVVRAVCDSPLPGATSAWIRLTEGVFHPPADLCRAR